MCAGRWSLLGILLLTGVLIANLYNLQIVRFTDYQTRSNENRIKLVPIPPSRGIIYDRNGIPLALNRTIYQIEMMPEKVDNIQDTLDALRNVVDLTDDDIAAFKRARPFTPLHLYSGKTNLTEVQVARFAVNQYRFHGVEVKGYKRRYYPYGSALTHVIGYVSKINDKDVDRPTKTANWLTTRRRTISVSSVLNAIMKTCCMDRPAMKKLKSTTAVVSFVSLKRSRRRPGMIFISRWI